MRPFVPQGWTKKLLLIGEAPGADEDQRTGRPFTGRSGRLLRQLWREAGYDDRDVALVNAIRCRPRDNQTPSMSQVRACRPFLLRAIVILEPSAILAVGGTALRSLTNNGDNNVTHSRGRPLPIPGLPGESVPPAFVTYHPAAVLRGALPLRQRILDDLKRFTLEPAVEFIPAVPPPGKVIFVDTEYTADRVLSVAATDGNCAAAAEDDFQVFRACLEGATYLGGHSAAGELQQLHDAGLPLKEEWLTGERLLDSLLLARMVDENDLSYELEDQLLSFTNTPPWKYRTKTILQGNNHDMSLVPADLRMDRCVRDAWASYHIAAKYGAMLALARQRRLVVFTHRVACTLERMSLTGAFVDLNVLNALRASQETQLLALSDQLSKAAWAAGMTEFKPTNDNHIRDLLYTRLGLSIPGKTDTGLASVSKESLRNLPPHHVVETLLKYNAIEKLHSTNVVGLDRYLRPVGTVADTPVALLPFHFNPLGARTGRRSASNPNSQNWTPAVRQIICSRWPGGMVSDNDYSKLEPLVLGFLAKEPYLNHHFGDHGSGYIGIAKDMWGYEIKEGTPEYRGAKGIVLGVHYNMQTPKMSQQLWNNGIRFDSIWDQHVDRTDHLRRAYLRLIPHVVAYMHAREDELLRHQSVRSLTGRVRHLPCPDGRRSEGFGHMLNQAINFPVQSLAADVTGAALVAVEAALIKEAHMTYGSWLDMLLTVRKKYLTNPADCGIIRNEIPVSLLFNEVHDDLVVDLHPDRLTRDQELITETMKNVSLLKELAPGFDVPLRTGSKANWHWYGWYARN